MIKAEFRYSQSGYYGIVGKDKVGKVWLDFFKKTDLSRVVHKGNTSVCACLLTHKRNERAFLVDINLKEDVFFNTPDWEYLNSALIIYLGPIYQNKHDPLALLNQFLNKVKGPKIFFSPSLMYVKLGLKRLKPVLKNIDVLFVNRAEIESLTNLDPNNGSKFLRELGPKIVVCTLGSEGVLVTTTKEQFHLKAQVIKTVVDPTGAGDTFAAGFT